MDTGPGYYGAAPGVSWEPQAEGARGSQPGSGAPSAVCILAGEGRGPWLRGLEGG